MGLIWEERENMQRMPVILLVTSAVLWGGAISADAADARLRIWVPLFAAAGALTVAGLNQAGTARAVRSYEALTRAVLTRPLYRDVTGPQPAVPAQSSAPASGGRSPHGRHASRV